MEVTYNNAKQIAFSLEGRNLFACSCTLKANNFTVNLREYYIITKVLDQKYVVTRIKI